VTDFRADVLLLKYAQNFYGADASVISTLKEFGIPLVGPWPKHGDFRVIETKGALPTPIVIFVGVGPLYTLGYDGIQDFGFRAIEVVAGLRSPANHISMTLHGSGFGLDELESAAAQLAVGGRSKGSICPRCGGSLGLKLAKPEFVGFAIH
jgi:hypothetical protein